MFLGEEGEKKAEHTLPPEAVVYPVRSCEQLIGQSNYRVLANRIRKWVKCDEALYTVCYKQLVDRYAEFVQCLPNDQRQGGQTSMLVVSVRRALLLVEAFSKHLVVREGKMVLASEFGARVLFAVFSSALLFEVGRLSSGRQMHLCNEKGMFVAQWCIFEGSMVDYGHYFKVRYGVSLPEVLLRPITHLLARQLMPTKAMVWLAEDHEVMHRWFEGLTVVDAFFEGYRADLDVDALLQKDPLLLEEIPKEQIVAEETLEAEKFWEWLKESLQEDTLDAEHVAVVDGELLLDLKALTHAYGRVFSTADHHVVLTKQFNHLGIAKMDGQDFKHQQYFSKAHGASVQNAHAGVLFGAGGPGGAEKSKATGKSFVVLDAGTTAFHLPAQVQKTLAARSALWTAAAGIVSGQAILTRLAQKAQSGPSGVLDKGAR